ncbi:MAG: D-alanyl-D-alanine carboxypeptidase [Treponema sp.]|jgi:D-alanyl-D-alanine carboxypeptidase (penicillin-binding protein 5/6)|nr:D-alanyl-D-alanine carboxypeptidase [Treponema sp.]
MNSFSPRRLFFLLLVLPLNLGAQSPFPAGGPRPLDYNTPALLFPFLAGAPEIRSRAAVLIDTETGTVLYVKNQDEEIPPASLTKLMTIHLVLNAAAAGSVSLDDIVPIGPESWAINQPPRSSLMFLAPGQTVTLREILLGLAVSSGNDAAVAAALSTAPTVRDFVSLMNFEARRMGLVKTRFTEPSGVSENNMTTAGEFALFCREYLFLHPESLAEYHSVERFAYPKAQNTAAAFRDNSRTITQNNRNALLKTFPGVDGLKTGYIDEAGYNIALTAEREGTRLIAVILGAPADPGGDRLRDEDGAKLLSWAFANFKTVRPPAGDLEPARLWKGKANWARLKPAEGAARRPESFTAPAGRAGSLRFTVEIADPLTAPLPANYPVGNLVFFDERGELHRVPLLTESAYERGNIFKRIWHSIRLLFYKKG